MADVAGDGKALPGAKRNKTHGLRRIASRCGGRGELLWLVFSVKSSWHAVKYLMQEAELGPRMRVTRQALFMALTLSASLHDICVRSREIEKSTPDSTC